MLFKRGNRSFKFCLVGLNDEECAEMSTLIRENGGEICEASSPAVMKFTKAENYVGEDPVFHVNYIRECVRRGQLLDLIHFKLGKRGPYSCLMSLFIRGESTCPFIDTIDTYCTPTEVQQFEKRVTTVIDTEHNYAQGDTIEQAADTSSEIPSTVSDPVPQGGQKLPEESFPESAYFPSESFFFPNSEMSEITETIFTSREEGDRTSENREPVRNEKLSQDQTICSPNQTPKKNTMIKLRQKFPFVSIQEITVRSVPTRRKGQEPTTPQTSFISNTSESSSEINATEKNGSCKDSPVTIKQEVDKSYAQSESQPLKNSDSSISESSTLNLENSEKTIEINDTVANDELVAGVSENAASPTILKDEFNRIKILGGGTKHALRKIIEFHLTSDSDETIYDSSIEVIYPLQRRVISPVANSSTCQLGKINGEKRLLERKSLSPLRVSDSSDNEVNVENVRDKRRTRRQSTSKKKSNHKRQTTFSSTRSSDDVLSISEDDSVSISEGSEDGDHSSRAGPSSPTTNKTTNQLARPNAFQHSHRLSRNFLPWEQRAMIKYLINKNCILDAKGYRVWKQMIDDGYLRHRTYQSLHNHFRKSILPYIDNYSMKRSHLRKFKQLQE